MKCYLLCLVIVLLTSCAYQKSPYILHLEQENNKALEQSLRAGVEPYYPEYIAILPTNYQPKDLTACSRWYPTGVNHFLLLL